MKVLIFFSINLSLLTIIVRWFWRFYSLYSWKKEMGKTYLYLLKRNKKDTKVIGTINCNGTIHPTRILDLDLLGLAATERLGLKKIIEDHKMDWELWLESAENYSELKSNMEKRKLTISASPNAPMLDLGSQEIPKSTVVKLNKNKIMTRRMN